MTYLNGLKKHASKFGSDGVIETAIEAFDLNVAQMADLIAHCDEADFQLERKKNRFATKPKHRLSYETRAKRALRIPDEGEPA